MELTQKAQGDLARTMDSPANKARILKEKVAELSIEIGNALLPIVESIMAVAKPIVEWFAKLNPGLLRFVVIIGMMVATIGPIIAIVGNITSAVGGLSTFLAGFNITGAKTTAIVLGVVAALIALAAIIAVLTGKTGEIERTFKAIGTSTQSIPQGVSIPHYARGGVHGGGLAITDEEGGELKYLPNKTVIVPHDISMEMARNMGKQSQPVVQNITVMVQAHELQQMADVVQLFENLKQTARAR
jgi:hypothetical protein